MESNLNVNMSSIHLVNLTKFVFHCINEYVNILIIKLFAY